MKAENVCNICIEKGNNKIIITWGMVIYGIIIILISFFSSFNEIMQDQLPTLALVAGILLIIGGIKIEQKKKNG